MTNYFLARANELDAVKHVLEKNFHIVEEPRVTLSRSYLDTPDSRLIRANQVLESNTSKDFTWLDLRQLNSSTRPARQRVASIPAFAQDLPRGAFRDRLEKIAEVRALQPRCKLDCAAQTLRIVDKRLKTTLRLVLERTRVLCPKDKAMLCYWVRAEPVRGYPAVMVKLSKVLKEEFGLTENREHPMSDTLKSIDAAVSSNHVTQRQSLRGQDPIRLGLAILLKELLATMAANEDGIKANIDSEFLHDFRVAVRRSRSILNQLSTVYPARTCARFKTDLAWIARATSAQRDLDVFLLDFDSYAAQLEVADRSDFIRSHEIFAREHRQTHHRLLRMLNSKRYAKFKQDWEAFLDAQIRHPSAEAQPSTQIRAGDAIWRCYRRTLKQGRAITARSRIDALHELRKTGKKLRYLIEAFRSLYPDKEITALIKELKSFQDNLGSIVDFDVQIRLLRGSVEKLDRERQADKQIIFSIEKLMVLLGEKQHNARAAFAKCFNTFARHSNQRQFKRLFQGP